MKTFSLPARRSLFAVWGHLPAGLRELALAASSIRVLVEGDSMLPALAAGDRLLVARLAYRTAEPRRGEIVLLRDPLRPGYECIKRIIGLPGERVRLEGLTATISGREADRDPLSGGGGDLGPDFYFVVGDNLAHSTDSRAFGPVPRRALIGRVWYRYAGPGGRPGRVG